MAAFQRYVTLIALYQKSIKSPSIGNL